MTVKVITKLQLMYHTLIFTALSTVNYKINTMHEFKLLFTMVIYIYIYIIWHSYYEMK